MKAEGKTAAHNPRAEKKAPETASDVPEVYVTKYALTLGIRRCKCRELDEKYGWVEWPGAIVGSTILVSRKDVHHTVEAAQVRAKELATKRLKALEKQRKGLEKISSDGAKIVESQ